MRKCLQSICSLSLVFTQNIVVEPVIVAYSAGQFAVTLGTDLWYGRLAVRNTFDI